MISWNAGDGAKYYDVQYYSRADGVWKSDPDYSSGTSYVTTGLSKFESYQFRVRAANEEGVSDWATVTYYATYSAPNAPSNLTAAPYGENSATLSWDRSDHILYYEVQYYSERNGRWMDDEDYSSELSTSYVSTGLSNFDSYDYRVRAVNSFGASAWVTVTYIKPIPPDPPTGLTADNLGDGKAHIYWNSSPGASSYDVQYYSEKNGEWRADSDYTGGTSYVSTGLYNFDSYQFRVRAKNSYGVVSDWREVTYYTFDDYNVDYYEYDYYIDYD